ncbi:hypothetical protein BDY21DRAFT_93318 [Lineolata rhizophorae]|uniref:Uncharacterized protein n=1 Tax=Lineolata rhizophorae TaxID=578093 RepID=A0A6A6PD28_9PEZI|nr:hypothetical protein BDY21DRAFT_93318 [Lineolata rhizophorae]
MHNSIRWRRARGWPSTYTVVLKNAAVAIPVLGSRPIPTCRSMFPVDPGARQRTSQKRRGPLLALARNPANVFSCQIGEKGNEKKRKSEADGWRRGRRLFRRPSSPFDFHTLTWEPGVWRREAEADPVLWFRAGPGRAAWRAMRRVVGRVLGGPADGRRVDTDSRSRAIPLGNKLSMRTWRDEVFRAFGSPHERPGCFPPEERALSRGERKGRQRQQGPRRSLRCRSRGEREKLGCRCAQANEQDEGN